MTFDEAVAESFLQLRRYRKKSTNDVAAEAGCNRQTISRMESGKAANLIKRKKDDGRAEAALLAEYGRRTIAGS